MGRGRPLRQRPRGRIPLRRSKRNPVPPVARLRSLWDRVLARRLRSGLGASEGTQLLEAAGQPAKVRNHVNNREMFENLCPLASLCPPPAA